MATKNQVDIILNVIDKTPGQLKAVEDKINKWAKAQEKSMQGHLSSKEIARNRKIDADRALAEAKAKEIEANTINKSLAFKKEELRKNKKNAAELKKSEEQTSLIRSQNRKVQSDADLVDTKRRKVDKETQLKESTSLKDQLRKDKKSLADIANVEARTRSTEIRTETFLTNSAKAESRRAASDARREARDKERRDMAREQMYGRVAASGTAIGGLAGAFSLKNYMEMEQMTMRMRLMFGKDSGTQVINQLKDFAANTAFSLPDAARLLQGVKLGAESLGVDKTADMVDFMKKISVSILGYVGKAEDREEVVNQLTQVFSKGVADTRMDLRVMEGRGLPIRQMITEFASAKEGKRMDMRDIFAAYGDMLPAKLIAQTMEYYAAKPEMVAAMRMRSESFTQSWDTFTETLKFTSASLGETIDVSLGLGKKLGAFSKGVGSIDRFLISRSIDKQGNEVKEYSIIGQNIIKGALTGIGILGGAWLLPKLGRLMKTVGEMPELGKSTKMVATAGVVFSDYGKVLEDIIKDPVRGLATNFQEVAMAAIALTTPMGRLAAVLKVLYDTGFFSSGSQPGEYTVKDRFLDTLQNKYYLDRASIAERQGDSKAAERYRASIIDTDLTAKNVAAIKGNYKDTPIILNVENKTIVDGVIQPNTKSKTTVRNPFGNPITKEVWN